MALGRERIKADATPAGARPRALLTALALCLPAAPATALNPELAITQYTHRAWRADQAEGSLPQNSVASIQQTHDGYLWLATQEGLVRFDGVRFKVFSSKTTDQIRHNDVWTLLEDLDGSLWIGTHGGGLTRLKDGVFVNFGKDQGLSSDAIQALWQAADGSLWIGTRGGGLNRYKEGTVTTFTTKDGLPSDTVYSLRGDREGNLWIGTDGGGLSRFRDGKFTAITTKQGLSNDTVYTLLEDRDGSLWIGTGAGLNHYQNGRIRAYRTRDGLTNDNIRSLHQDREGNLWIGTDGGGLNRYTRGTFSAFTTKQGLSNDNIGAMYEDREGSLWIGTDAGGLNRLKDNKFVSYGTPEGLPNDNARSIIEDADGALWIGTWGGLARFHEGRFTAYTTRDGLSNNVVLSLALGRDGALWAGTLGGGLNRLHKGRFTRYGKTEGLSNNTVLTLLEDSTGTLWAGTRSGGLNRLEPGGRFRVYTTADGLTSDDVRHIVEARAGGLWIGTLGGGLNRYKNGKFTAYTKKDGLSSDLVLSVYEEANGTVWAGTFGGGLSRLKDGKITAYTARNGMFDDVVFQILDDDRGNLWLSSNHGVARVSKQELDDFAGGRTSALHPTAFGVSDGMRNHECNGAHQPAGWKARDGRLWFPTIQGIATVDPNRMPLNTLLPPVVIEEFRVNQHDVALGEPAELPPGRSRMDFQFTALSLLAPEKVQFRYKLEGYDEDWVQAGTRRSASYTNLPPGRYAFRVAASNNDGLWNEQGAAQEFYLKPYFYQRRAFYLVYVLALALAAFAGMRLQRRRVRQLQARERELLDLMHVRQVAEDALKAANQSLEGRVAELARAQAHREGVEYTGTERRSRQRGNNTTQEIDQLVGDFNTMLAQLAEREGELQEARDALALEVREKSRANEDLEQALMRLKLTQSQLVQSEKMASLGSLVAGVAHEINTPVGVGVTAASTLQEWAQRLQKQHRAGTLTRSDLEHFVEVCTDSTQILMTNLHRAAELIRSFKQVAVDQSSGERRRFMLKAYIDEILLSLAPRLNRTGHTVTVDCPGELEVDSYPGALAQIVTNLVTNSLVHAFPENRRGHIGISAREEPGGIVLRYADNGIGIPPENLRKIYDPFFTTRRGAGGSGLGMHIVYNLVTQRLGGTIAATSKVGEGAIFEVRFPAQAARAAAA